MLDYRLMAQCLWGIELSEPNESGWISGTCPIHQGEHINFGINVRQGWYNCFKCGCGSIRELLERTGCEGQDLKQFQVDADPDELAAWFANRSLRQSIEQDLIDAGKRLALFLNSERSEENRIAALKAFRAYLYYKGQSPEKAVGYVRSVTKSENDS